MYDKLSRRQRLKVFKHDDGTEMIYAHSRRLLVQAGDQVNAGQVIGEVGNTGLSAGPHLHLEMRVRGEGTNPASWVDRLWPR